METALRLAAMLILALSYFTPASSPEYIHPIPLLPDIHTRHILGDRVGRGDIPYASAARHTHRACRGKKWEGGGMPHISAARKPHIYLREELRNL